MPGFAHINLRPKVVPCDPDGCRCSACKENIFLKAYKLSVFDELGENVGDVGNVKFCQGCGEVLRKHMKK